VTTTVQPGTGRFPVRRGLRELRKERTRATLESVAIRLFAEQGFDATTVEEIAAIAEVSPRTFFRYFPSKESVVLERDAELRDRLFEAIERHLDEEDPTTMVRLALEEAMAAVGHDQDDHLLVARILASSPALRASERERQRSWEEAIAKAVARRMHQDPERDLHPRLVGALIVAALTAAVDTWLANDATSDLATYVDAAFRPLKVGLPGC
jgi:AcrR family transcriptional regulator